MKSNRTALIVIGLLVVIIICLLCVAAGLGIYLTRNSSGSQTTPPATPGAATPTSPTPAAPVEWSIVSKQMTETTANATVNLAYPQLKNFPDATIAADFNSKVEAAMQEISDTVTTAPDSGMSLPNSANLDFTVAFKSDKFVSIAAQGSEYFGGAHPNALIFTFNYDLVAKKVLKLADLFTSGSNYLQLLSEFSIAELNSRGLGELGMVEAGAGEDAGNFIFFDVTSAGETGIELIFPPYQVAPYAAGTQIVSVPVTVFESILKPEYQALFADE